MHIDYMTDEEIVNTIEFVVNSKIGNSSKAFYIKAFVKNEQTTETIEKHIAYEIAKKGRGYDNVV